MASEQKFFWKVLSSSGLGKIISPESFSSRKMGKEIFCENLSSKCQLTKRDFQISSRKISFRWRENIQKILSQISKRDNFFENLFSEIEKRIFEKRYFMKNLFSFWRNRCNHNFCDAGIHGPRNRSLFLNWNAGIHRPRNRPYFKFWHSDSRAVKSVLILD